MSLLEISEPGQSAAKAACAGRAVGIDLGTTNSLVATVRDGQPIVLGDESGDALVPSVVHYAQDGRVLVGRIAQELAPEHPTDTIASAKRFMGRAEKDVEAARKLCAYEFVGGDGPVIKFRVGHGRVVTPVEVSADVLRVLRARAETALDGPIDGAVITVPAYFDDAQRQATKDAAKLAGLDVLRLLNEPTAAALAYGLDKGSQGVFAVYDLGGGTFDISILKLTDGVFEVKATAGDSALGGDDLDRALAGRLLVEMDTPDGGGDNGLVRRVLDAARAAKERLSREESTRFVVARSDGRLFERVLTRVEVEPWFAPIVEKTGAPCRRALKDAAVAPSDIDGVVLVGGATRTPLVRRHVEALFGQVPLTDIDPDRVVALGAAIQADILAGHGARDDILLLDVIPLSLGIEMMGGIVEKIIPRNSTIPAGAVQTFTTFADQQTGFNIHVLQGERETVEHCRSLARFQLTGLPPRPAGVVRMDVTLLVDPDGILRVTAKEHESGKEASIQVKPSYGLTDEEVERMLLDSYEHAAEDLSQRALIEQRVAADRIIAATERAMKESAALLESHERTAIRDALAEVRRTHAGTDHRAIRDAIEALDLAAKSFAQKRMELAINRGIAGRSVDEIDGATGASARCPEVTVEQER